MNIILQSYKDMWTRILDFKGRSNPAEYWWPFLINVVITIVFLYLIPVLFIVIVYNIAIFVPCIALAIRRLHDANKSGWNVLWLYIPTVILLIYASAILYYTQKPEVVDMFLNWFTIMVVGYAVFLVYSIYLLTHYTHSKKNHYGAVPHLVTKTNKLDEEVLLEAPAGASVESTMTFKTKAFLEKAKNLKKRETTTKTEELHTDKEPQEKIIDDKKEPDGSIVIKPKKRNVVKKAEKVEVKEDNKVKVIEKEKEEIKKVVEEKVVAKPVPVEKEEIIVMAQLKPSKKRPAKKVEKTKVPEIKNVPSKDKNEQPEVVKTITQKRAEAQQSSTMPKANIMEELKETKEAPKKVVHRPIKRKVIQPVEVPNVNVESIRTHSLDSIAKLVEQNMTKDPKEAPTVVANMKKQPIKRKRKEETEK